MRFELKNVKINKALSDETTCFSADLWADGKKVAGVVNRGHGGCHQFYWTQDGLDIENALNVLISEQPPVVYPASDWAEEFSVAYELDHLIDDLLDAHEKAKKLKAWCKKETLFRLVGDKPNAWRSVKALFTPGIEGFIRAKYGDKVEQIVNAELDKFGFVILD